MRRQVLGNISLAKYLVSNLRANINVLDDHIYNLVSN